MTLRRAAARLLALFRKRSLDSELEGEVQAHLELAGRDLMARGMSAEEARRTARIRFGGIEHVKEEHRDRRGFPMLESLARDFRYGLASLARYPGFSAAAVGVLALGIGASVAMFSIVDAVFLKPLPFPGASRIVSIWEAPRPGVVNATSTLDFLDWRRLGTDFEAMSAEQSISGALTGTGEPLRLAGKAVTADYFRVFSTPAEFGRTFTAEDAQPGAQPLIVLSHACWISNFGGDPDILNRRPVIDGQPHQVIGVLPAGVFDRDEARFWKPLVFTPEVRTREIHWLTVRGRLREGSTLSQARERLQAFRASMDATLPASQRNWKITIEPLENLLAGDNLRRTVTVGFGAVALVLLIACGNAANLLLAKGAARRKELAVRAALGAGRGRLVGQLLTETLVLSLAGAVAGMSLASLLLMAAKVGLAQMLPYTAAAGIDTRAAGFCAGLTLVVTLLAGVAPALRSARGNSGNPLNEAARGSSGEHAGIRRVMVTGEFALSLVLVCGALLLFRTLLNLQRLDTGVRIDNIVTMSVNLPEQTYPGLRRAALYYSAAAERLSAAHGVAGVGLSSVLPLQWIGNGEGLQVAGMEPINVRLKRVDPGYFRTFEIPILSGRGITAADREGSPGVVVLNETLAARLADLAGIQQPIGRKVRVSVPHFADKGMTWTEMEIVGVIRSERVAGPGRPDPPVAYVPLAQIPHREVKLSVRSQAEPASVMPAVREALHAVDPNLPLGDVATMQQVRNRTLSGASRPAWLIGVFAGLAVLLAAIGLYGVLSYAVTQQRREIGIRMALGALSRDVVAEVLRNAFTMILAGLALGMLGAFAVTRVLENLLFEVSPLDPLALGAACVAMMVTGLIASFVPANRAARVDPVTTLRDE